jgi:ribosomal protein L11 methyltransferase
MSEKIWKKVIITAPDSAVDAVADFLAGISGRGVHLEEGETAVRVTGYMSADHWEDRLFKIHRYMDNLAEMGIIEANPIEIVNVPEEDWLSVFRSQHSPVRVSDRLTIRPTWCDSTNSREVVLDPGMAFGTGSHATTRMCLTLLDQMIGHRPPERMFDLGTGTGVLAIAAAFLGVKEVLGTDIDPVAVSVARNNVRDNGLTDKVTIREGSIETVVGRFDIVAANLTASLLKKLAAPIYGVLSASGKLIISGIMVDELEGVLQAFGSCGLSHEFTLSEDVWNTAVLSHSRGGLGEI